MQFGRHESKPVSRRRSSTQWKRKPSGGRWVRLRKETNSVLAQSSLLTLKPELGPERACTSAERNHEPVRVPVSDPGIGSGLQSTICKAVSSAASRGTFNQIPAKEGKELLRVKEASEGRKVKEALSEGR